MDFFQLTDRGVGVNLRRLQTRVPDLIPDLADVRATLPALIAKPWRQDVTYTAYQPPRFSRSARCLRASERHFIDLDDGHARNVIYP